MFDINRLIIFFCMVVLLLGCGSGKERAGKKSGHIVTVTFKPMTRMLYFNGTVKPLSVAYVVSPVEGTVEKKEFHYGQSVKAGALLLTIGSSKLESDYQAAVVQYLKAKDKYLNDQAKFANTEELMRNDLIAKETFDTEKQTLASSRFDYLQAQLKIEALLKQEIIDVGESENVSLKDIAAVEKVLRMQLSAQQIMAPKAGVVLFPLKLEGGDTGGGGSPIEAGSPVKANQVLLMIGDLSGISMDILVGEQDVHQIKVGQTVTVTGPAFPEFQLKGIVKSVGAQAKATSGTGGPPTFAVEVAVPHLTNDQRREIQVGMSAKIALALPSPQVLSLPVKAVFEKEGGHWVKVLDPKTKQEKEVLVKTGKTTLTDVVIESGLESGMQVVVP